MLIDIKKIKQSRQSIIDFDFDYNPDKSLFDYSSNRINGCVKVTGTATLQADEVYVNMTVCCTIVGECARCLEDAQYDFNEEVDVTFVRFNPGEDDYLYNSGVVNLEEAVNDVLLSNFPIAILCKEDCKGLCPKCGCNLNIGKCSCEK